MILFFSDLHLGLKHCSKQENDGLFTSEIEAFKSLDYIYEYAKNPENRIDLILFGGDWFHVNTPSSLLITMTMNWLNKLDKLNIQTIFITGNHSSTVFSNCLCFIHEMNLKNIILIDKPKNFRYSYNDYNIYFSPYIYSESMKERDVNVENNIIELITNLETKNNIVVSHIHESNSKIGSESLMIAKNVEVLNLDEIRNIDMFLLGHIHREQVYVRNGITVLYSGSTTYQDKSDVNQRKGFYVIQDKDNYKMEVIPTIRKYHKININQAILNNLNIVFQNRKFAKGDVLYFDCKELDRSIEIEDLLLDKCAEFNFVFGTISYEKEDELENTSITITEENPKDIFRKWVENLEEDTAIKEIVTSTGFNYIEKISIG